MGLVELHKPDGWYLNIYLRLESFKIVKHNLCASNIQNMECTTIF